MKIQCLEVEDVTIIHPTEDKLCGKDSFELKSVVKKVIDRGCKRIVLDLAAVSQIDSAGLVSIFACHKMIQPDGKLLVVAEDVELRNGLSLTRLNRIILVKSTRQEALSFLLPNRPKTAAMSPTQIDPALVAEVRRAYGRI